MSNRREAPKQSPDNRMERIGATVRQRALTGSEASTVGFILVIYIFAGAGLGYLLDKHLETTYWIAIGMLFGTVVGFREMFRLTKKLTKNNALDDDTTPPNSTVSKNSIETVNIASPSATLEPGIAKSPERTRIFSVPAPPQASFEKQRNAPEVLSEPVGSTEELIERLTQDGSAESDKPQ